MSAEDTSSADPDAPAQPGFPVATLTEASQKSLFLQSKMWWVTIVCLVLAIWLAWRSVPETGPEIVIHFPQGHGLKAGDTVRYRGIDVGSVLSVNLNETLSSVDVQVMLKPEGGPLDREGTRFWIVRPQLSLTKVTGLETAVGSKYIGVSPGDPSGPHVDSFDGLPAPPPDELSGGGLDLVLRSDNRHGLSVGAPVTWRGVEVGQVLSVTLSHDARHVQASVRINRGYRRLVRDSSKFWVTSGFGVDIGLSGLKLNAQSLTTIARGGVSFITPASNQNNEVTTGHVFDLAPEVDDEWLKSAAHVPLIDFDLPMTVTVQYEQRTSILGIPRSRQVIQTATLLRDGGEISLLTSMIPAAGDDGHLPPATLVLPGTGPQPLNVQELPIASKSTEGILRLPVDVSTSYTVPATALRFPEGPEECLIVRTAGSESDAVSLVQSIDSEQLMVGDDGWRVTHDDDLSPWDGAPVVAIEDGRIIGVLAFQDAGPVVVPLRLLDDTTPTGE